MRTWTPILAALALGGAASGAGAAQADPHAGHAGHAAVAPSPAIDPDVDAFVCNWFGLLEKGDVAPLLDELDGDFVIQTAVGAPIADREQFRKLITALQASTRQQIRWATLETRVAGDWAWARVAETSVHHPRAGGAARTLKGSHLMVLRKASGRWRLHRDYGALDTMPEPASPAA